MNNFENDEANRKKNYKDCMPLLIGVCVAKDKTTKTTTMTIVDG